MPNIASRPWAVVAFCLLALSFQTGSAAVTPEQREKVNQLNSELRVAGNLYKDGELVACSEKIIKVQQDLVELMKTPDAALHRLVKPLYSRLGRAHGLLELEGAELEPLPSWSELIKGAEMSEEPSASAVSFQKDIAPWFVSKCGNCHVNNQRGQFSLATYQNLMAGAAGGTVLFPGSARGSRLVEVIESGDMPRGGGKVSDEQLQALKNWIDQGAKFDGPNPTANITSYVSADTSVNNSANQMQVAQATGDESVSFARDVAPILMENCQGCHIGGRRASGNLRMDSFRQLLRGGDSGELIAGTNANESLLVKKLKGQAGQRMPAGGRPPLSDDQIELISTWIKEGSKFDGPTPETNIEVVVNQAWASAASHEELFAKRQARAQARWNRVLPNASPSSASSDEVVILGNVTDSRAKELLEQFDESVKQVKKLLRAPARQPLIKGGLAVFVLKSRYDYSEFGRMTEERELPKEWPGHWQADPLDVYGVLCLDANVEEQQLESLALQVVAGAYVGSRGEVPVWFSEGVARNLVIGAFRRGDDRVKAWQQALPVAVQKVPNARALLDNRLDEESAGLVGMAITSFMMDRTNRRRFDKLMELITDGREFDEAMTLTFAPPEQLVKTWLGKK